MEFLNPKEQIQLQKTLFNSELLKDAGLRGDLLTNCGLRQYTDLLPLDRPTRQFAISLCAKLSGVYATVDDLQKPALVIFLEHISDIDNSLSADDALFIKHVINKWERSQTSGLVSKYLAIADLAGLGIYHTHFYATLRSQ